MPYKIEPAENKTCLNCSKDARGKERNRDSRSFSFQRSVGEGTNSASRSFIHSFTFLILLSPIHPNTLTPPLPQIESHVNLFSFAFLVITDKIVFILTMGIFGSNAEGDYFQSEILNDSTILKTHPKAWLVRPCSWYKDEYKECSSFHGKLHQYFIYGKTLDCSQWQKDYDNCLAVRKNPSNIEALVSSLPVALSTNHHNPS